MFDALKGSYHRVWIWLLLAITMPYGIRILLPALGWEVIVPTEPLIAILIFFVLAGVAAHRRTSLSIRWAPIDVAVLLYALAHIPAAFSAAHTLAAVKATMVQWAHIALFYVVPRLGLLPTSVTPAKLMHWWALALPPLVLFAWTNHILTGLDRAGSHHTAFPFFMDHNGYAAGLCFAFPVFGGLAIAHFSISGLQQRSALYAILALAMFIAVLFSFSRGAWLGVLAGCLVTAFAYRQHRLTRYPLMAGTILAVAFVVFIFQGGRRGDNASHHDADLLTVIRSIGNTTNDPSNVDRLSRWKEAYTMFRSEPFTGVGPGNFQFALSARWNVGDPGKRAVVMPIERMVPAWQWGDRLWVRNDALRSPSSTGTAHSEYFLAFSELGVLGGLGFCGIALILLLTALRGMPTTHEPWTAIALFAVIAYLAHGLFNNFLDEARLAFPFWLALAIVAEQTARKVD